MFVLPSFYFSIIDLLLTSKEHIYTSASQELTPTALTLHSPSLAAPSFMWLYPSVVCGGSPLAPKCSFHPSHTYCTHTPLHYPTHITTQYTATLHPRTMPSTQGATPHVLVIQRGLPVDRRPSRDGWMTLFNPNLPAFHWLSLSPGPLLSLYLLGAAGDPGSLGHSPPCGSLWRK